MTMAFPSPSTAAQNVDDGQDTALSPSEVSLPTLVHVPRAVEV
jgi:hypothetical protein